MPRNDTGCRRRLALSRRELLQVGYSGMLGLGLPGLLAAKEGSASAKEPTRKPARSVILIFLTGAPSHIDTFDQKPSAPAEVRGAFKPVSTSVPGVQICEHLPMLAARADRWAVIRSMTHGLP